MPQALARVDEVVDRLGRGEGPAAAGAAERLRQAGKPPKLAFVAVARKLLTILNAIARERIAWKS